MKISLTGVPIVVFFACELIWPIVSALTTNAVANVFCNLLIVFSLLLALPSRLKNIKGFAWLLALVCVILFVITGVVQPEYQNAMYREYNIWTSVFSPRNGIMLLLILTLADDPDDIFRALKVGAIPVWVAYTIRAFMGVGLSETSGSNHAYGYAFLFVSLIYTISFFRQKKTLHLGVALIALFQVIMYASRTAILSYVVFFALYMLFYDNDKKLRMKKTMLIVLGVLVVFVVTSDSFLHFLSDAINKLGFSSRIIDAFISGNNQLDGGRERTYRYAISLLKENPWGLGVYWDRYLCEYSYVHNFVLEVLLDFGWLFGGLILVVLIKNILMIMRGNEKSWKALLILFFSLSMIRLTLSYSFWYDNNFWAMIAIIIGYRYSLRNKKKISIQEQI